MTDPDLSPHGFWQDLYPPGSFDPARAQGHLTAWPGTLPDGRQILQPIRPLPDAPERGLASLIVNQASFAVLDALLDHMAPLAAAHAPDVVLGVPTLGLPLAEGVARRLGHGRFVALGTSRKFWYDERLSVPLRSVTSPGTGSGVAAKRLYLDPRMVPLLAGRRVLVVDDVLSSGASLAAVLALLELAGVAPVAGVFAMLQGDRGRALVRAQGLAVAAPLITPLLARGADGRWRAAPA